MISIILVTYHHYQAIKQCLDSIKKNRGEDYEVIIVNNSPEEKIDILIKPNSRTRIIEAKVNLGYAKGCNLGASQARGEYLVFLNPDSRVSLNWLEEALKAFKDKKVGIVMSKILQKDKKTINSYGGKIHYTGISWAGGCGEKEKEEKLPYEVIFASGASLFIKKDFFDELGKFDSRFFMYMEDVDLSFRARLLKKKIVCAPASVVYHDYEYKKGDYKFSYLERNRLFFIFKNYSLKMIILFFPAFLLLELGLGIYFLFRGKIGLKLKATAEFFKNYKYLAKHRGIIQGKRQVNDRDIFLCFSPTIESREVNHGLVKYFLNPILFFYWRIIRLFFR